MCLFPLICASVCCRGRLVVCNLCKCRALSGAVTTTLTYPLDLTRTRLSASMDKRNVGLVRHTCVQSFIMNIPLQTTIVRVRRVGSECIGFVQATSMLCRMSPCSFTGGRSGSDCSKDIPAGGFQRDVQGVRVTGCLTSTCHITLRA